MALASGLLGTTKALISSTAMRAAIAEGPSVMFPLTGTRALVGYSLIIYGGGCVVVNRNEGWC